MIEQSMDVLHSRTVGFCCVQELRWIGLGTRFVLQVGRKEDEEISGMSYSKLSNA